MGERFGEPWSIRKTTGFDLVKSDGGWIGSVTATHAASAPEVAERVRVCVNAHVGDPDPAATMKEVVEVLRDCAEDLESMVEAHYGGGIKDHPAMKPKYERDMEPAERARAILAKLEGK